MQTGVEINMCPEANINFILVNLTQPEERSDLLNLCF